jgi:hypothetical protein
LADGNAVSERFRVYASAHGAYLVQNMGALRVWLGATEEMEDDNAIGFRVLSHSTKNNLPLAPVPVELKTLSINAGLALQMVFVGLDKEREDPVVIRRRPVHASVHLKHGCLWYRRLGF